ncbi:MAG: hypothetical protein ACOY9Y_06690 [Bacillota bacterium]
MGESDVQSIRQDIGEVKQALSDLNKSVTDLRVLVAGNYVTKEDFLKFQEASELRIVRLNERIEEHEKEEKADRWKLAGLAATVTGIIVSVVQWVVGLARDGGNS